MIDRISTVKIVLLVLGCGLISGHADAHAALVDANPAANATTTAPQMIELRFSEAVEPRFSGFIVTREGDAVDVGAVNFAHDNTLLMAMPSMKLPAGNYKILWHALSDDAHKTTGEYHFRVQ